jgi:hypothetical protein
MTGGQRLAIANLQRSIARFASLLGLRRPDLGTHSQIEFALARKSQQRFSARAGPSIRQP